MIRRLVWRSLARRPGRSALLLAGYALGVGVTVALLSIGSALLEQARDRELAGGGDLAVLPAGIDLETIKTGGVSSLYFSIDQAPFLYRQVLAGQRFDDRIEAAAPWIDDELVHLETEGGSVAASAGGRVPSLSRKLGVRPDVVAGSWTDVAADRAWRAPGDSALYASMDRFHLPPDAASGDSTWAEWHYFNVRLPGKEADGAGGGDEGDAGDGTGASGGGWLYLTFMVTGAVPDGRWGGRVLATVVSRPEPEAGDGKAGGPRRGSGLPPGTRTWEARAPDHQVAFSLTRPDLEIGTATVALDADGVYRLEARLPAPDDGRAGLPGGGPGSAGVGPREEPDGDDAGADGETLSVDLEVRAATRQHLPPLDVSSGGYPSGYTVPVLDGRATGRVCVGDACTQLEQATAYHDHNWGVWSDVTWDWGQARAGPYSVLYGDVRRRSASDGGPPGGAARDGTGRRFLFLTDTLGFLGLFPIDSLGHRWTTTGETRGGPGLRRPRSLGVRATRPPDTVRLHGDVRHVRTSRGNRAEALFHQMEGRVRLRGRIRGRPLQADGAGFFETWAAEGPDRSR